MARYKHIDTSPRFIADNGMRARDERFANQDKHKAKPDPLWDKSAVQKKHAFFGPQDFTYDEEAKVCICPAGEFLDQNGGKVVIDGRERVKFTGAKRVCEPCPLRDQCSRHPERTAVCQVVFFKGKVPGTPESFSDKMKRSIDSPEGRVRYGRRFATVEPVFGNLCNNKRLDRFTLRGKKKVDGQWKLICLLHNEARASRVCAVTGIREAKRVSSNRSTRQSHSSPTTFVAKISRETSASATAKHRNPTALT